MTDSQWPDSKRFVFDCDTSSFAMWVQHLLPHVFAQWDIPEDTAKDALTVVVELLRNAVKYAEIHPVHREMAKCVLLLNRMPSCLGIAVEDISDRPPMLREISGASGRRRGGLYLVDSISSKWGYTHLSPLGKSVWAEISILEQ